MPDSPLKRLALAWAVAGLVGCGTQDDGRPAAGDDSSSGGGNGSGDASRGGTPGTGPGVLIVEPSEAGQGSQDPDRVCFADSKEGARAESALLFMVDISRSMYCPVDQLSCDGDPSDYMSENNRWGATRGALETFVDAPQNAGLWAGIGFFPHTVNSAPVCDRDDYADPAAEIAQLPGAAATLKETIERQLPDGSTPTQPALEGALGHAKAWAAEHAGLRVAVVLATDGHPHQCDEEGNTIEGAAQIAADAYLATPSIATYVLAIGQNLTDISQIAQAGGTTEAIIIDSNEKDVATQLLEVLGAIRDKVFLTCAYTIPEPPNGKQLDLDLVNVRYESVDGEQIAILQDPVEGQCHEGWQYSDDRTEIQLCGEACDLVQNDLGGRLDVLFGCRTQVARPK